MQFRSGSGSLTSADTPRSSGERSGARSFGSLERVTSPSFVTIDGRDLDELIAVRSAEPEEDVSITRWETKI